MWNTSCEGSNEDDSRVVGGGLYVAFQPVFACRGRFLTGDEGADEGEQIGGRDSGRKFAKVGGGQADVVFEGSGEGGEGLVADFQGDVGDGAGGLKKQFLGPLNAEAGEKMVWSGASDFLKDFYQMRLGVAAFAGEGGEGEIGVPGIEVGLHVDDDFLHCGLVSGLGVRAERDRGAASGH